MTAVQQYWIVENDVNLVSNLTPVPVADEEAWKGAPTLAGLQTDSTPLDGWTGVPAILGVSIVTVSIPEYDNPYDTSDKWKGSTSIASVSIVAAQRSYDNPYDTADKWKGSLTIGTLTVTTVVVQYDNLYDTADKWKGAPALTGVTIT